jgi:hypothetical protein
VKRTDKRKLTRGEAMACRPTRAIACDRRDRPGGGAEVSIELASPAWLRLLSGRRTVRRTYGLDAFGAEVYDACDGRTPVKRMCRAFAGKHKIAVGEAEAAVAQFLKTLMAKGLVVMAAGEEAP